MNFDKIRMEYFIEACQRFDAMGLDADEATRLAIESTEKYMKEFCKEYKEKGEDNSAE